ncbi:MAG: caspase family protein, partial [Bacteroidota bacterium]
MLHRALSLAVALLFAACAGSQPVASADDPPPEAVPVLTPPDARPPEATRPATRGGSTTPESGTQRALLVAINAYNPPGAQPQERSFADLSGPVNDLRLMRETLINRYGFRPENIDTLTDAQATREGILTGISAWIDRAEPGDHLTFYFSGHGSQADAPPGATDDGDQKFETIVPYDAALGASDVVDRDLRQLWNRALDRVQGEDDTGTGSLTIIQDNCNSGSGARGPRRARKVAAPARVDFDPGPAGRVPASRGALVLAAAQDDEEAMELYIRGEHFGGVGGQHGGFTASLVRALRTLPVGAPASLVMEQTASYLPLLDLTQNPDATGPVSRPLFGAPLAPDAGLAYAVESVTDDGHVILRGGSLAGLDSSATLAQALDDAPEATLRVVEVLGPSRSRAEVTSGTGVTEGSLFRPTSLAYPPGTELAVWLPPAVDDAAALAEASGAACSGTCTDALAPAETAGPVELPSASGWVPYPMTGAS